MATVWWVHFYLLQNKKYLQEILASVTEILGFQDEQFEQSFSARRFTVTMELTC